LKKRALRENSALKEYCATEEEILIQPAAG